MIAAFPTEWYLMALPIVIWFALYFVAALYFRWAPFDERKRP